LGDISRPTGKHQASCDIPIATPRINQYSLMERLTPCPAKEKKLNNKQGTCSRGAGYCKCNRDRGRSEELISM
jgi:hypothetical protein